MGCAGVWNDVQCNVAVKVTGTNQVEAWEDDQRLHRAVASSPDDGQGLEVFLMGDVPELHVTGPVAGEHLPGGRTWWLVAEQQGGRGGGLSWGEGWGP